MFWTQAAFAFVLWVALGVWRAKGARERVRAYREEPNGPRMVRALGGLVGGDALLLLLLLGIHREGGFRPEGMTAGAWLAITAGGAAFLHLQLEATLRLVANAVAARVTDGGPEASRTTEEPR